MEATSPRSTILIVESAVVFRFVVAQRLRENGFRIIEAGSADEAIEVLKTINFPIQILLSRRRVTGCMDGMGLAHYVRVRHPGTKVVLVSGLAAAAEAAEILCNDRNADLAVRPAHASSQDQHLYPSAFGSRGPVAAGTRRLS